MKASKYQLLLSALIAALDAGKLEDLDTDEVRLYACAGAISILLGGVLRRSADVSILTEADWKSLNDEVARMALESPQTPVPDKKGITLLMAWALQGIARQM